MTRGILLDSANDIVRFKEQYKFVFTVRFREYCIVRQCDGLNHYVVRGF